MLHEIKAQMVLHLDLREPRTPHAKLTAVGRIAADCRRGRRTLLEMHMIYRAASAVTAVDSGKIEARLMLPVRSPTTS